MLSVIPDEPAAARCTDADIVEVVAVCSSTADTIVVTCSLIRETTSRISLMLSAAPVISAWMPATFDSMCSVARAVARARSLTSLG